MIIITTTTILIIIIIYDYDNNSYDNRNDINKNNYDNNNDTRSTLSSLPTETAYGFLNFTTTMQDKIMVFTSQPSASTGKHKQ